MVKSRKPATALQQFVRYYVQFDGEFHTRGFMHPVPARTAVGIDFMLGDLYEAWFGHQTRHETTYPVALIGAQTWRRVDLAMHGHVEEFVILFQPGGLTSLFAVPPDILTDQHFDGRAVLGRPVDELRHRLGDAGSFAERIRVADEFLLARAPEASPGGVIAAARALHRHRGGLRISSLAEQAGLSLRQFERRFIAEVGMSPKLYARVARFEAALEIRMRSPQLRWTDIAHELGYHDQMHLIHDFRQFSSTTPSDIAPRVDLLVAPEVDTKSQ